jgi:hypothetical protein
MLDRSCSGIQAIPELHHGLLLSGHSVSGTSRRWCSICLRRNRLPPVRSTVFGKVPGNPLLRNLSNLMWPSTELATFSLVFLSLELYSPDRVTNRSAPSATVIIPIPSRNNVRRMVNGSKDCRRNALRIPSKSIPTTLFLTALKCNACASVDGAHFRGTMRLRQEPRRP